MEVHCCLLRGDQFCGCEKEETLLRDAKLKKTGETENSMTISVTMGSPQEPKNTWICANTRIVLLHCTLFQSIMIVNSELEDPIYLHL